jgi:hypothetical protein
MKCSKLIDILQQLEYELDDPNVVIRLCDEYDPEVAIDFNYANQFVAGLLPEKLSDDILESIKAALINFAIGMVATGLILAIAAGLGALIGALIGCLAGGVGAAPGAALGAKIGFEIGLFLLKWIGLGFLAAQGVKLLGGIGIAFGKYVTSVWQANGEGRGKSLIPI